MEQKMKFHRLHPQLVQVEECHLKNSRSLHLQGKLPFASKHQAGTTNLIRTHLGRMLIPLPWPLEVCPHLHTRLMD